MRFTIVSQYYPPEIGAAQVRLSAMARELSHRGHQVQVITAMPNYPEGTVREGYRGKAWQCEYVDGIPVFRTWIYPATGRSTPKRLACYFSFAFSSIFGLLRVPRAEVVFVESPPLFLGFSGWLVAALRQQRFCLNISDLWPDSVVALGSMTEGVLVRAAYWLELWLYRRAWRVCGATEGIVESLITRKEVERKKVLFLPNGVDTESFRPLPYDEVYATKLGLGGRKVFAYTGLHGYAQGLDVVIDAADRLRNRDDLTFLFVGEGPEKPRLQQICRDRQLPNVSFLAGQPTSQMPSIYALTTACIVPLRDIDLFQGARPSKIFPALACGKPVIFSGSGEAARLIEQAHCGLVTPPENAAALAVAIEQLADFPEEAIRMGQNGRAFVEQNLSWGRIMETWLGQITHDEGH